MWVIDVLQSTCIILDGACMHVHPNFHLLMEVLQSTCTILVGACMHAHKFPSAPFNASTCLRITMACMEVLHVGHGCTTKHMYNFGRCLYACPSKFSSAPFY
jgi:hypothetical protein